MRAVDLARWGMRSGHPSHLEALNAACRETGSFDRRCLRDSVGLEGLGEQKHVPWLSGSVRRIHSSIVDGIKKTRWQEGRPEKGKLG